VDRLVGKQSLVVQRLDSRLGKVQHVSSGAILEDGSAALVLDADDLFRSLERALEDRSLSAAAGQGTGLRKRVLVVDDSITVREVERNVLEILGLDVDVAVDGMDGWHSVRHNHYDLVVSDIDMPRMDGIELVTLIKENPSLRHIPVILVSYKDREEDRMRGLAAGADYYMSKGNFQDDSFRQAVLDLLGHDDPPSGAPTP
jgi:two-component system, chemotaxis family, sensor histidine kinase and response regulator WspE